MGRFRRFILVAFFVAPFLSYGQQQGSLPASRRGSDTVFIYKVGRAELRRVHFSYNSPDESMLHTPVGGCKDRSSIPALPRGNYLLVDVRDNRLNYTGHTVDDICYQVVSDKRAVLFVYDTLGRPVTDARVGHRFKRMRYDRKTGAYDCNSLSDERIIEIDHDGVYHYVEFMKNEGYQSGFFRRIGYKARRSWYKVANLFDGGPRNRYKGFVVFSKPRYKPGETVRFKAYMTDPKGRPVGNERVGVALEGYDPRVDTVLLKLDPYRPGMYEGQFRLSDSLRLTLDKDYTVRLRTGKKNAYYLGGNFRYEEYELKKLDFKLDTDKEEYVAGDTVRLTLKATDENDMPVYDGRVEVTVTAGEGTGRRAYHTPASFVPDVMWHHSVSMDDMASREFILPDSIFPPGVSMQFQVKAVMLSSDNEKHEQVKYLFMDGRDRVIDFKAEKGMMTVRMLHRGVPQPVRAEIEAEGVEEQIIWKRQVTLPYTFAMAWDADFYSVRTEDGETESYWTGDRQNEGHVLGYKMFREKDSVRVQVDNPAGIPFWYTLKRNKRTIAYGRDTTLNMSVKGKDEGYALQLSYLLGEEAKVMSGSMPFTRQNITMAVSAPSVIYPGQKTLLDVAVEDKKGRPVQGADITSWAYTSKFGERRLPVPVYGTYRAGRLPRVTDYEAEEDYLSNTSSKMTWERWRAIMGLDALEYYRFLYPTPYYCYAEPAVDSITQIMPYLVIDGRVEGLHLVWIDGKPRYFQQSESSSPYAFRVDPGFHRLRLRSTDREVTLDRVWVEEGQKTILSVDGGKTSAATIQARDKQGKAVDAEMKITVVKHDKPELTSLDMKTLGNYMAGIGGPLGGYMAGIGGPLGGYTMPGGKQLALPGYIEQNGVFYAIPAWQSQRYDGYRRTMAKQPRLIGPMGMTGGLATVSSGNTPYGSFALEGGYNYEIYQNYLKSDKWERYDAKKAAKSYNYDYPIQSRLRYYTMNPAFGQSVLTPGKIAEDTRKAVVDFCQTTSGEMEVRLDTDKDCRLELMLKKRGRDEIEKPVFVMITGGEGFERSYYGGTRKFNLKPGEMKVTLVFPDTTTCTLPVTLHGGGTNYLCPDTLVRDADNGRGRFLFGLLASKITPDVPRYDLAQPAVSGKDARAVALLDADKAGRYNLLNFEQNQVTGLVTDERGDPVVGASVVIKGTTRGAVTDAAGVFTLPGVTDYGEIEVSFLGYTPARTGLIPGYEYHIRLDPSETRMGVHDLQEVVVVGYGSVKKASLTGSVTQVLESRTAGVMVSSEEGFAGDTIIRIRGMGTLSPGNEPLYIVDGVPMGKGYISKIAADKIASIEVLKDASATAVYGSRAASGVIIITTKDGAGLQAGGAAPDDGFLPEGNNSMRRNFHDDAFWQPRLTTDKQGKAQFEVTWPDDITNWQANFIALAGRRQTDQQQVNVRSFRALTAQLSVPAFMLRGDSLEVVGKMTNYRGDTVQVTRTAEVDGRSDRKELEIMASHVDKIPVKTSAGDSLKVSYSLQRENGYFDGEERTIPIFEQGTQETSGSFRVISDGGKHVFDTDPALGPATVYAEASSVEMFLREIEKVKLYPYMCNEQMASKLKALMAQKRICELTGTKFAEERAVNALIGRLNRAKNSDNLWGWWSGDGTQMWISGHVVEAMLEAGKEGYKTDFDRSGTAFYLKVEIERALGAVAANASKYDKRELARMVLLLHEVEPDADCSLYVDLIAAMPGRYVGDHLLAMLAMAGTGQTAKINIDTLDFYSKKSVMGSLCWPERGIGKDHERIPHGGEVENTLTAYRVLRALGGRESEMAQVRNYLLKQRSGGSWRNTYESSRVIETILPDMVQPGGKFTEVTATINGHKADTFPYKGEMPAGTRVEVGKQGTMPLFVTVYQQGWVRDPQPRSTDFRIATCFVQQGDTVSSLTAGKPVELRVQVNAPSDTRYVMIEVPIPSGCSYESKELRRFGPETHREYFKERVAVFCTGLPGGEHTFVVKLLPRITGRCTLNPARAELMYFPTFYGRNKTEVTEIH